MSIPFPEVCPTRVTERLQRDRTVPLQYPHRPRPRYGYGRPVHRGLAGVFDRSRGTIAANLRRFSEFRPDFATIPLVPGPRLSVLQPYWQNGWFEGLDAVSLYAFLASVKPRRFFEIGGGNSTKFARRAILDNRLPTQITSIDPVPRADVDRLCNRVIRARLEEIDPRLFGELQTGDMLSFDGSHYVLMNSDVTVFFLEIFPNLPPGVWVHIHDIHLPADYPMDRHGFGHYYSEQYLLAAYLLGGDRFSNIQMASAFVALDDELAAMAAGLWEETKMPRARMFGGSFWAVTK